MVQYPQDSGTLVPSRDLVDGTVLPNDTGTLVANSEAGTMLELQSNLGTMVINSDTEEEPTMKSKLKQLYCSSVIPVTSVVFSGTFLCDHLC
jgi:hypothetical protein